MVEKEFKLAIELSPSSSLAHLGYSTLLSALGRTEESLAEGRWCAEVDPLAPVGASDLAFAMALAGRNAEALKLVEQTIERFPSVVYLNYILGVVHERAGRYAQAIACIEKCVASNLMHTIPLGVLGHTYAITGRNDKAAELLARLEDLEKTRPAAHFTKALIYAGLCDMQAALQCLEKAYEDRSPWLYMLNWYPWLESLRGEPRFQDLVRRVGLPS